MMIDVPDHPLFGRDRSLLSAIFALCIGLGAVLLAFKVYKYATSPAVESFRKAATPVLLYRSRTTHTRLTPVVHSFSYTYFSIGIPVPYGSKSIGWSFRGLSAFAEDYLYRNREGQTPALREKLDDYLQREGLDPKAFPAAYLVTAPRVLGYSFNPVSFWYLYGPAHTLDAMILEVNNTFDERRMYFLQSECKSEKVEEQRFTSIWKKDFHVSPFNDREGSYSLVTTGGGTAATGPLKIQNTITLLDVKGQPKLVARLISEQEPLDLRTTSLMSLAPVALSFGWVGFVTFPRILRQAFTLFFRHKLSVFFRPEVASGSIGQQSTASQRKIEGIFRAYLADLVKHSAKPLAVRYTPSPGIGTEEHYDFTSQSGVKSTTTITVTSPAFYSRFLHYIATPGALQIESTRAPKNRTLDIHNLEPLIEALQQTKQDIPQSTTLRLVAQTRCPIPAVSYPEPTSPSPDLFPSKSSDLEKWLAHSNDKLTNAYARLALWQFISTRLSPI